MTTTRMSLSRGGRVCRVGEVGEGGRKGRKMQVKANESAPLCFALSPSAPVESRLEARPLAATTTAWGALQGG